MVGCAPYNVKILLLSQFVFMLKIRGVDASDMQNPRLQYNILNKVISKNSRVCRLFIQKLSCLIQYLILNMGYMFTPVKFVINN